jgi:hypothetical protein
VSLPVPLASLAEQVERFGEVVYVITADEHGKGHVVSVTVAWAGDELVVGAGRRTSRNVEATGTSTLLWPAPAGEPYSLIVDGDARVDAGEAKLVIRPTRAVLHRVAGADPDLPSCVTVLDGVGEVFPGDVSRGDLR